MAIERRPSLRALHVLVAATGVLACVAATARARETLDLVPARSLLCWYGRPEAGAGASFQQQSTLQTLLEIGSRVAGDPLDRRAQLNLRMIEMLGLTAQYPHALALIDAQAKPLENDPNVRRVDRLRFALIVRCGRRADPFLRIVQKTVNEQTDSGEATLESETAGAWHYQQLRDRRLPDWTTIAWGQIDEHFVLTVGQNVWPSVAAVAGGESLSLARDPWYAAARGKRAGQAQVEIFVAARAIRERLDPFVQGRASSFFAAWEAEGLEQAHWSLGYDGDAQFCLAHFLVDGRTVQRLYADPDARMPRLLATVPPDTRHAIYNVEADRLLRRFFRSLVEVQGQDQRAKLRRLWAQITAEQDIDVEHDLFAHLGNHIVLHTYPPHPLHVPLALTSLTEIREQPEAVGRTIDAICEALRARLEQAAAEGRGPPPFTLHHDPDGIWYLRFGLGGSSWFGLAGPAWTTTDRFVITSWSPLALREYLDQVGEAAGRRLRPAD
jgi:hypothetical protein